MLGCGSRGKHWFCWAPNCRSLALVRFDIGRYGSDLGGVSGMFPAPNNHLIQLLTKLLSLSLPVPSGTEKVPRDIT
jgi:hypothetical protein